MRKHFRVATGCSKHHAGWGRPIYVRPQMRVCLFFWRDIWPEYRLFHDSWQVEKWLHKTYGNDIVMHKSVWRDF